MGMLNIIQQVFFTHSQRKFDLFTMSLDVGGEQVGSNRLKDIMSKHKPRLVIFAKGGRIGSFLLDSTEAKEILKTWCYNVIQVDVNGTTHISVLAVPK